MLVIVMFNLLMRPSEHETWCRDTVCIFSEESDSVCLLVFIIKVYRFRIKVYVTVLGLDVFGQR